jgi:lauroyl/myristoyl acyltransferase
MDGAIAHREAEVEPTRGRRPAPDDRAASGRAPFGRGPRAARVLARVIDGAAWAGSRTPVGVAHALAAVGGNAEWAARPGKRAQLAANLAHAVAGRPTDPAVRRLVRRELVNEARRSADLLWALGRPDEFLRTVEVEHPEHPRGALARGRGLILAGIHLGGWEVATGVPRAILSAPSTVVVADDWLAWAIEHMRTAAGLQVLYRTAPAVRAARILQAGEVLVLLGDNGWGDAPRRFPVRFLDGWAELPSGMVTLARLGQTPIVGFTVLPSAPRRWRVILDPPVDPPAPRGGEAAERAVLQQLADRWSERIATHPEHWAANYPIRWRDAP